MGGSGENGLRSQATEPFPLLSQRGKCSVAVEKMVHSHDCNWLYFGCKVCVSGLFTVNFVSVANCVSPNRLWNLNDREEIILKMTK